MDRENSHINAPVLPSQYGSFASTATLEAAIDRCLREMIQFLRKYPNTHVPISLVMGETSIANHAFQRLTSNGYAYRYIHKQQEVHWFRDVDCIQLYDHSRKFSLAKSNPLPIFVKES